MNATSPGNDRILGLCLALLVLALLGLTLAVEQHDAASTVGIAVAETAEGIAIDGVNPGAPADLAGLEAGDLLFEVNDVPVARLVEYDQALQSSGGSIATFHVRRDARELVLEVQPGVPFPIAGFVRTLMLAAAYLGLAALALQRRRRDWRAGLLAILCFSVAIELAMPDSYFGSQSALYFSLVVFYLLTGLQCAVELHLVSTIPQRARWARRGRRVNSLRLCSDFVAGGVVCPRSIGDDAARCAPAADQQRFPGAGLQYLVPALGLRHGCHPDRSDSPAKGHAPSQSGNPGAVGCDPMGGLCGLSGHRRFCRPGLSQLDLLG